MVAERSPKGLLKYSCWSNEKDGSPWLNEHTYVGGSSMDLNSTYISALSRDSERNHEAPAGQLHSLSLSVRLRAKRGLLGGTLSGVPGSTRHKLAHALTCILVVLSGGTVNDTIRKMPTRRAKCLPH